MKGLAIPNSDSSLYSPSCGENHFVMGGHNFKDNINQQEGRIYLWQDPRVQRYVFALACVTSSSVYYNNIDVDCRIVIFASHQETKIFYAEGQTQNAQDSEDKWTRTTPVSSASLGLWSFIKVMVHNVPQLWNCWAKSLGDDQSYHFQEQVTMLVWFTPVC